MDEVSTVHSPQSTARGRVLDSCVTVRALRFFSSCGLWTVVCGLALAGCASQAKQAEADLATLAEWLPGRYDNVDHVGGDVTRQAVVMRVVPFYAAPIGKAAFYVHETAAEDPRRVLRQRVIAFDVDSRGRRVIQAVYSLTEPGRWRDAHESPDLFTGLIPHQDLRPMAGCELVWTREADRFVGVNEPSRCRATSRATGAPVNVQMRAELSPGELALAERSVDSAGRVVEGDATPQRYTKRAED
jgi:hypothetical protein